MKHLNGILFMAVALFAIQGCYFDFDGNDGFGCKRGNGNVIVQRIFIPDFHSINMSTSGNVYVRQGDFFEVEVEIDENLIDEIRRTVRNGKWDIEFDRCIKDLTRFDVYVTMPEIRALAISGSGDIIGENEFSGDDLELTISGSGNMDIAFNGNSMDTRISGSGNMRLEGDVVRLDHEVPGSGDLRAFSLFTEITKISNSGSGDSEVSVSDLLIARISGSGDIYFKGDPDTDIIISGSGDVIRID